MSKLNIGTIKIPINAATRTFAILAKRGAGKSYTAAVLAEEFYKSGIPFVVFDPIDVWWGLRLSSDGKGKGLPIVVFGKENADIPLDRDMGREIARAVVKENISCVISTYGMPKVAYRHLIAEFADELLMINRTPRHVFIEEAHEFVPQRVFGAMSKVFSAVESLVVMGRNKGIGVTLINQRAATVNKDVLTQLDTLLAFRNVSPQDRKALKEWVEAHGADGDFEKFMKSLPSLPTGEGWIWSPEFMGVFERIKIRQRETFHPDREKLGIEFKVPHLDQGDIQNFIEKFTKKVPKKDESKPQAQQTSTSFDDAIRGLKNEYESKLMEKDLIIQGYEKILSDIQRILGVASNGGADLPRQALSGAVQLWQEKLGSGLAGRMFKFLSENPTQEFSREQICLAIGVPLNAGHTANEFGRMMRTGAVTKNGKYYRLNQNI